MRTPETDPVAAFKRLLEALPAEQRGGGVELLLGQMEPQKARQLRLCAIPHSFDPELLHFLVLELDAEQARQRCAEFARLAIVIDLEGRFALHDDARSHLFQWWLQPQHHTEFVLASADLVRWFAQKMQEAFGENLEEVQDQYMFHLLGCDREKGFVEFERLFTAARHGFRLSRCAALVHLVEEYRAQLSSEQCLWLNYHTGKLYADHNDLDAAQALFEGVLTTAAPVELRIKALNRLGQLAATRHNWPQAISFYHGALEIAADAAVGYPTHGILHDLAVAQRDNGELSEAQRILEQAIAGAAEADSVLALATCHNSLGTLHLKRGDLEPAVTAYSLALECLDRAGDSFRKAQVLNNLGMAFVRQGKLAQGEQHLSRSLKVKQEAGDSLGEASTLNNLVEVYRRQGKAHEALEACLRAIALFREMRATYQEGVAYSNLGQSYRDLGDKDSSREAYEEAVKRFRACGAHDKVESTQAVIASLAAKGGLPWWAWVVMVLPVLLVIFFIAAALLEDSQETFSVPDPFVAGQAFALLSEGEWAEVEFALGEGFKVWRIAVEQPGDYVFSAIGVGKFDPVLLLRREDEDLFDDDGGGGRNAHLEVFLAAGEHFFAVAEYEGREGLARVGFSRVTP